MPMPDNKNDNFVLKFTDVDFSRGDKLLFSGLTFEIKSGHILWVQGDNGIGKTSILKLALGLWTPDSGKISISWGDQIVPAENVAAYLGHQDAFEPLLTLSESLEFWAEIYRFEDPINATLQYAGLAEQADIRISGLSAGQKRRLALARLIIADRPLWVLDEPKAAMDKTGQALIDEMLADHVANNGAVIIASHDKTTPIGKYARRLVMEAV